ncbi:hypothetical protein CDAR_530691 [Caerostris darwini]|uniref:Uncharacterized protein n=1 Tax=Caerostris darwini TaxID=1538125 RepID=A0AAV4N9A3_9ARAC|nr:hypothetical protein CDAR_530691 [Caerostris darwini]
MQLPESNGLCEGVKSCPIDGPLAAKKMKVTYSPFPAFLTRVESWRKGSLQTMSRKDENFKDPCCRCCLTHSTSLILRAVR